jgi:hypothetical protein
MDIDLDAVDPALDESAHLDDEPPSAWEFGHLSSIAVIPPEPVVHVIREADEHGWEIALQERYSPKAMAHAVFDLVGSHLSLQARSKKYADGRHGVNVRGSFCLGVETGDIFDLDVLIDEREDGVVPGAWKGPREEGEKDRFWSKLEGRQWF